MGTGPRVSAVSANARGEGGVFVILSVLDATDFAGDAPGGVIGGGANAISGRCGRSELSAAKRARRSRSIVATPAAPRSSRRRTNRRRRAIPSPGMIPRRFRPPRRGSTLSRSPFRNRAAPCPPPRAPAPSRFASVDRGFVRPDPLPAASRARAKSRRRSLSPTPRRAQRERGCVRRRRRPSR